MAKSLMKNWDYECAKANLAGAASSSADANADPATFIECTMVNLLRSIINGQNAQIQTMRELLDGNGWPEFDNCDRPWEGTAEGGADEVSVYVTMDVSRYGIDDEATEEQVHEHSRRRRRRRQLQTQSDETPLWVTQLADAAATTQVVDSGTATETASVVEETDICRASCSNDTGTEVCTFTAKLDLFASDLGMCYWPICQIQ